MVKRAGSFLTQKFEDGICFQLVPVKIRPPEAGATFSSRAVSRLAGHVDLTRKYVRWRDAGPRIPFLRRRRGPGALQFSRRVAPYPAEHENPARIWDLPFAKSAAIGGRSNESSRLRKNQHRLQGRRRPRSRGDFAELISRVTQKNPRSDEGRGIFYFHGGSERGFAKNHKPMNPTKERYTPGHSANATAFMAARDLDSHGFFLAPLLQPGFDVLDAGCGPATITTGIAERVFPARVTAVDISQPQLETARRLAQGREIMNIDFVAASACQLPFDDHSFDVVFANALLEHLRDPAAALSEFHRVTRPGGFIAVCSPDWERFSVDPLPAPVSRAIAAYRGMQERNGGNTRAGAALRDWLDAAGFTPLVHDEWIEEYEEPARIAEYLALQLENAGQFHHATALRGWKDGPAPRFLQCWKYATGVRADDFPGRKLVLG